MEILFLDVAGPGLVFQIFPVGMSMLPLPQLWSALFFLTLIFVAVDTAVSAMKFANVKFSILFRNIIATSCGQAMYSRSISYFKDLYCCI